MRNEMKKLMSKLSMQVKRGDLSTINLTINEAVVKNYLIELRAVKQKYAAALNKIEKELWKK